MINKRNVDENAKNLIKLLNKCGYEAYLVGGCVRDLLLNKTPKDWDICTNAKPQEIISVLRKNNIKFCTPGIEFGTVVALVETREIHGKVDEGPGCAKLVKKVSEYEITTYRAETAYRDNRHPDEVKFIGDLKGDLSRRDFTINAMAYNPITNELVDYFNGQEHLSRGIIETVGDAEERFSEDSLRILRAIRFAVRYNFSISLDTASAMKTCVSLLDNVSKERITQELEKMLTCGKNIKHYFTIYSFVIERIIPEIAKCINFDQNNKYHTHDVYLHMLYVVDNCKTNKFEIKLAALLHDIGKPDTYIEDAQGQGHFYGHPQISYEICKQMLDKNFRLTNEQKDRVLELVKYHDMILATTKKSVKRALNKHGKGFLEDWFILKQADMDDHIYPNKKHRYVIDIDYIRKTMEEIVSANECFTIKDLSINGKDIMEITNTKPGKHIGTILNALLEKVIDEEIENDLDILKNEALKLWGELEK